MSAIFWGFILRFGQSFIEAALTLLVGVVIAAVLRRMVGPAGTRKLFGKGWRGLLRGWFAGMMLPVCSLGVIPIAREMFRVGVPTGTVLAFVLAAPLLNPISFLYGLTLAEPFVIVSFACASLLLSTFAGFLWDRRFSTPSDEFDTKERAKSADQEPLPVAGPRRILAVFTSSAQQLVGRDVPIYLIGLCGSALISAAIPFAALQATMMHSDPSAPALMTAVAVPIYSSPLPGMMKIGLMFEHGNSVGAAFVLFTLGIGLNVGLLAWLASLLQPQRFMWWFSGYLCMVIGLAYVSEPLLYDSRKVEADHTHAFDDYSCPFESTIDTPQAIVGVQEKLAARFTPLERPAVYGFFIMFLIGLILRRLDRDGAVERWLTAKVPSPYDADRPWYNVAVPGSVLGVVSILGLIAFSVIGAYLYYPDRKQCLDQMFALYADTRIAIDQKHQQEAIRHLENWDLLVRKLEVGVYLRSFGVTEEQHDLAEKVRERMETVRDFLIHEEYDKAIDHFRKFVEPTYRQMRDAYRPTEDVE